MKIKPTLFKDSDLKEEVEILDFGNAEAGKTVTFKFYILNDLDPEAELINLEYKLKKIDKKTNKVTEEISEEAKITSAPKRMSPNSSDVIIIEYSPKVSILAGLRVMIETTGQRLYD